MLYKLSNLGILNAPPTCQCRILDTKHKSDQYKLSDLIMLQFNLQESSSSLNDILRTNQEQRFHLF